MKPASEQARVVAEWHELARRDLRAAKQVLALEEDCPFEAVCFHTQQSVEKNIKALLVHLGIDFQKTHDVGELVTLLPKRIRLPISVADQERLTDWRFRVCGGDFLLART